MLELAQVAGFLAAAVLVTLAPGPDNLMVLSLGAARGRRHGVAFGLGCAAGCLSHTVLAAAGFGALVAATPLALLALKLAGGLYLAWLGIQILRHSALGAVPQAAARQSTRALFVRGLVASAVNPKVILFFLAFLPQFVVAGETPAAVQILALGALFAAQAALLFGAIGLFAGTLGGWLARSPKAGPWLNRAAGVTFIGLGARLALGR